MRAEAANAVAQAARADGATGCGAQERWRAGRAEDNGCGPSGAVGHRRARMMAVLKPATDSSRRLVAVDPRPVAVGDRPRRLTRNQQRFTGNRPRLPTNRPQQMQTGNPWSSIHPQHAHQGPCYGSAELYISSTLALHQLYISSTLAVH